MVLHNQICEGHICLAPFVSDKNFRDLKNQELFEIVLAIKELTEIVKMAYPKVEGTTVVM